MWYISEFEIAYASVFVCVGGLGIRWSIASNLRTFRDIASVDLKAPSFITLHIQTQ